MNQLKFISLINIYVLIKIQFWHLADTHSSLIDQSINWFDNQIDVRLSFGDWDGGFEHFLPISSTWNEWMKR